MTALTTNYNIHGETGITNLGLLFHPAITANAVHPGLTATGYKDGSTDLNSLFAPYIIGAPSITTGPGSTGTPRIPIAQKTNYKSGNYSGLDLNNIFLDINAPFAISGNYIISQDASYNTIIKFTSGTGYIQFKKIFTRVEYTIYGGGGGGDGGGEGYKRSSSTSSNGGTGGRGGQGGGVTGSTNFGYTGSDTYRIVVGAGGAGGAAGGTGNAKGHTGEASSIIYQTTTISRAAGGIAGLGGTGGRGGGFGVDEPALRGLSGSNATITRRPGGGGGGGGSGVGQHNSTNTNSVARGGFAGSTGSLGGTGGRAGYYVAIGETGISGYNNSGGGGGGGGGGGREGYVGGVGGKGGSGVVIFKIIN